MAFDIDAFRSNGLISGGARPSAFEVNITFPAEIADSKTNQTHRFLIKAASLPASDLGVVDVPYFGRSVRYAGDRTFGAWQVTVMNDEDFGLKNAFERWHAGINSIVPNVMIEGWKPANYKLSAIVKQYSKAGPIGGNITKAYYFDGLFPTKVGGIELDWSSKDQIEMFNVEFSYDFWLPNDQANLGIIDDFLK